jgi:hypothetical protein
MSPALERFLAVEDLDELIKARREIEALDPDDRLAIQAILEQWQNPQAVSNLLLHADLIPEEFRLASLFRGICERKVAYYVLAAIVGFQSVNPSELTFEDRERATTELWNMIAQSEDILAERASVSLRGFATIADATPMFALLDHSNTAVKHNLRAWLFSTFKDLGLEQFTDAARESGIGEDLQRQMVAEFAEFISVPLPQQGWKSPIFSLLSYIPNLRDVSS